MIFISTLAFFFMKAKGWAIKFNCTPVRLEIFTRIIKYLNINMSEEINVKSKSHVFLYNGEEYDLHFLDTPLKGIVLIYSLNQPLTACIMY